MGSKVTDKYQHWNHIGGKEWESMDDFLRISSSCHSLNFPLKCCKWCSYAPIPSLRLVWKCMRGICICIPERKQRQQQQGKENIYLFSRTPQRSTFGTGLFIPVFPSELHHPNKMLLLILLIWDAHDDIIVYLWTLSASSPGHRDYMCPVSI